MKPWTFLEFVPHGANNPIKKWWRKKLTVQQASDLSTLISLLRKTERWDSNDYKALAGAQKGLGEIRLKGRPPIRIFGCWGLGEREFVFLIGCTKKEEKYDPADALDTAVARKKLFDKGEGTLEEHYDDDEDGEEAAE